MRRAELGVGALCLGAAALGIFVHQPARADSTPGNDFGRFSLAATSTGEQVTYDFPAATAHPQAEGEVPESIAQLTSGPQGYARSTIIWPGSLAANAGSTAILLGAPVSPQQADIANEQIRAEARTGSTQTNVTNTRYPGTTMTATATDSDVRADTTMVGSAGPPSATATGNTRTTSIATLTGPSTALATATSKVQDINIGGVITIGSVESTASATTDGLKAGATGHTTVAGMKIAGQPAYVDQTGLHIGTVGEPVNAIASQIANQALSGAGMRIAVSQPSQALEGADVTYDAGNLVVFWAVAGDPNGDTFTFAFGGASVAVGAAPGFGTGAADTGTPAITSAPPAIAVQGEVQAPTATPTQAPGTSQPTQPTPTAPSTGTPPPRTRAKLPKRLAPTLPVLAVLGAGLMGFGLRRVPDRALEETSTTCTSEGSDDRP